MTEKEYEELGKTKIMIELKEIQDMIAWDSFFCIIPDIVKDQIGEQVCKEYVEMYYKKERG